MKNKLNLILFAFLLFTINRPFAAQDISKKYEPELKKLVNLWKEVKNIHQSLEKLYPVAISEDSSYYIFDLKNDEYYLAKTVVRSGNIPAKIRAAFPLQEYDFRFVCVVTGDVFENIEGYAVIFHEFVHCHQGYTIEMELKESMPVYREAMENKNYMWELNHEFPYNDSNVRQLYYLMCENLKENNIQEALDNRLKLKNILSRADYDYMTWQEWKEGFARFMENKLRIRFGLEPRLSYSKEEFNRVSFYSGGALLINRLKETNIQLLDNLKNLYSAIKN